MNKYSNFFFIKKFTLLTFKCQILSEKAIKRLNYNTYSFNVDKKLLSIFNKSLIY
jgi:hypothetical protein